MVMFNLVRESCLQTRVRWKLWNELKYCVCKNISSDRSIFQILMSPCQIMSNSIMKLSLTEFY